MNSKKDFPEILRDRFRYTHKIKKQLSQGGQGITLITEDPSVIIKLATKNIGTTKLPNNCIIDKKENPEDFKKLQMLFQSIKLLPLPKNIHVTVPQALLLDKAGYVMRFMEKMESLYDSICTTNNVLTYAKTGGIRKRLELSCKAFTILAQLHGSGIVFGDISPNNIFVTANKTINTANVWFIDSDNMQTISNASNACFTPMFAAPEVAKGLSHNTIDSDIYSLALITFYLCTSVYPFYGNLLEGEDWAAENQEDEDLYAKAHNGDFPFIDDFEDDSNFSEEGLPREFVFTDELRFLYAKMFSKDGRTNPETRPTVFHWIRGFSNAADITVKCQNESCIKGYIHNEIKSKEPVCIKGMTYLMKTPNTCCPYCDTPFNNGIILLKNNSVIYAREFSSCDDRNFSVSIPERVFKTFNIDTNEQALLTVVLQKNSRENRISLKTPLFSFEHFSASLSFKGNSNLTSFLCDKNDDINCVLTIKKANNIKNEYKLIVKTANGAKK